MSNRWANIQSFFTKQLFPAFVCLFVLAACDQTYKCQPADDFGRPNVEVPSCGYDVVNDFDDPVTTTDDDGNVLTTCDNFTINNADDEFQISGWIDSGLVTNGERLVVEVSGEWYPWGTVDGQDLPACNLTDTSNDCEVIEPTDELRGFCKMNKGTGLYMLLVPKRTANIEGTGIYDPNHDRWNKEAPQGVAVHLQYDENESAVTGYECTEDADALGAENCLEWTPQTANFGYGFNGELSDINLGGVSQDIVAGHGDLVGASIYLKVLDTYYNDNKGTFNVNFRSGVQDREGGVVTSILRLIMNTMLGEYNYATDKREGGIAQVMFTGVTGGDGREGNTAYINAVRVLLVLYIAIYGLFFMIGVVSVKQKVFLIHVVKFAIVVQLISPGSWDFFNSHFFTLFVDGSSELIGIMFPGSYSGFDSGFLAIDEIIDKFTSQATHNKIWAQLLNKGDGFIFVIAIYIAIVIFLLAVAMACFTVAMAIIAITLLISLAPLFLCVILFKTTNKIFQGWLRTLISYTIQPILLFAAIALLASLIMDQLYNTLGYQICWRPWFKINVPLVGYLIDWWYWLPFVSDTKMDIMVPPLYEYVDERYIDAPFIDPDPSVENNKAYQQATCTGSYDVAGCQPNELLADNIVSYIDGLAVSNQARIDLINPTGTPVYEANNSWGSMEYADRQRTIRFVEIFLFLIIVYLMHKFNKIVINIARDLGQSRGAYIEEASVGAQEALKSGAKWVGDKTGINDAIDTVKEKTTHRLKDAVGGFIEEKNLQRRKSMRKALDTATFGATKVLLKPVDEDLYARDKRKKEEAEEVQKGPLADQRDKVGNVLEKTSGFLKKSISFGLWGGEEGDGSVGSDGLSQEEREAKIRRSMLSRRREPKPTTRRDR